MADTLTTPAGTPGTVAASSSNIAMTALRLAPLPGATADNLVSDAICWVRAALGVAETLADRSVDETFDGALWGEIHLLQAADATLVLASETTLKTVVEGGAA